MLDFALRECKNNVPCAVKYIMVRCCVRAPRCILFNLALCVLQDHYAELLSRDVKLGYETGFRVPVNSVAEAVERTQKAVRTRLSARTATLRIAYRRVPVRRHRSRSACGSSPF